MPNGKLRGAVAREHYREAHEEKPGQTRRREKAYTEQEISDQLLHGVPRCAKCGSPDHTEDEWDSYEESEDPYYWAEPAPFTTKTGDVPLYKQEGIDEL